MTEPVLQDIADACSFSKSLLSKIQNGRIVPPVATLVKIANALGTKVSGLIEDGVNVATVYARCEESLQGLAETEKGYCIYPFASQHRAKKMQPFLFVARKGKVKEHHVSHEGEEFLYVIEGEMKFQVGADGGRP